jgi:phage FluMu protein Com
MAIGKCPECKSVNVSVVKVEEPVHGLVVAREYHCVDCGCGA